MPDEKFDETDAVLARKLAEITPPADLRARLLASAQLPSERSEVVEAPTRSGNWLIGGILAAAASLVLSLFLLGEWAHRGESLSAATADLSKFLSGRFELTMETSNVNQVREWLAANNPKHPVSVPSALAKNEPMGCRKLMWRGHAGSLACFKMPSGREAHLAMFSSKAFSDAPGASPEIASAGAWTRAAWSRDGMTYLLFVPAGMDPMKVLAGVLATQGAGTIASSSWWSRAWAEENVSSFAARISSAV
jgi:hypothetical protein